MKRFKFYTRADMIFALDKNTTAWDLCFLIDKGTVFVNFSINEEYRSFENFFIQKSLSHIFKKTNAREIISVVLKEDIQKINFLKNAGFFIKNEKDDSFTFSFKNS